MDTAQKIEKCLNYAYTVRASTTVRNYRYGLRIFAEYLGDEEITAEHFILFPGWMIEQGYTLKSMRVHAAAGKFFLRWLVMNNYIIAPDYGQSERIRISYENLYQQKQERVPWIPDGSAEKLLDTVLEMPTPSPRKERDIALVYFLYFSGCRNAEAVGLDIKDIDLVAGKAKVRGKRDRERLVRFTPAVSGYLDTYWRERNAHNARNPAFCRHDKGAGKNILRLSTASVQNIINDVCMVAGVDPASFTPHKFRHNFATMLLSETHNLALVQDALGHSTPDTTRIYAKVVTEELDRAYRETFEK